MRYPLALRTAPRPETAISGAGAVVATPPAGLDASTARDAGRPADAEPQAGAPSSGQAAGSGGTTGSRTGEAAGPGGFVLRYPAADAKISLNKSAASIEDTLVPPGLYRDFSKVDLSKTEGRMDEALGGGGGPGVGRAVPRAKRQTGRSAAVLKLPGVDFKPWAEEVLNKIQRNWALPLDLGSGWKGEVGVRVMVAKDGRVLGADLDAPTKIELLDQAALKAITAASPFPPLPASYPQSSLEVYFVFRYGD
jgi:TonB family protein